MQWTRLKQILDLNPIPPPSRGLSPDLAYREYAPAATARNLRFTALLIIATSVLSRIPDRIVFAGIPGITARLEHIRLGHLLLAVPGYFLLRIPAIERRPLIVGFPVAFGSCFLFSYFLGGMGDLDTPWFHFTYPLVACILLPIASLVWRLLFALAVFCALLLGLALARPILPPHPMLLPTVALLVFTIAIAIVCSQVVNRIVRRAFGQEQLQKTTASKLAVLNATLEDRVREQTRELRMLAAHLETTREDERARISRELHDELGQELTALRYALTFLKQRYDRDPTIIRGNVEELESLLARTSATVRQIVSELRPRVLDDLGLDAGIEWLLERTEERTGLSCRLVTSRPALSLDVEVSIAAFRILQESLTNVVRHARATHVEVVVSMDAGELLLLVEDDGVGAPSQPTAPTPGGGGMGIIGMRERADALGGAFALEPRPGGGTRVRVRLPAAGRAAAQEARS